MHPLYPEIKPFERRTVSVTDGHELYVELVGEPTGIPVLFVHGGPGGGISSQDRRYFDPEKYFIILFDQRGAGRSSPHASLEGNNTQALVNDIEVIRESLDIQQWVLFGGSWGTTLSLVYAQQCPERVLGMILRGVFLCRPKDLHWFYQDGASRIFPDYWQDFIAPVPDAKRDDLITSYYELLTGENELAKMAAAKAWSQWEGRCATLRPNMAVEASFVEPHRAVALSRIEAHYFVHGAFIEDNQILNNISALQGIPSIIVHGRYDMVCPLDNAMELHRAWVGSELRIVRDAGHSSSEPSIIDALVVATKDMALRLDRG